MLDANQQKFLNDMYAYIYNAREDYYEDSINLLSLLVITANYWNPVIEKDGSCIAATMSSELNMNIPVIQYESPSGIVELWANFEFVGENNGDMLWKLSDYGQNEIDEK